MPRRPILVPLAVVGLLLAACSDDGGGEIATGTEPAGSTSTEAASTESAPAEDTTCADLDVVVLDQVGDPGPEDTRPEGAGPTPEELQRAEEGLAAFRRVAEHGPEGIREDAAAVAAIYDVAFAWLDADGLAVRSETAAAWSGQWTSDVTSSCNVGVDTWDGPNDTSVPPPPLSTSVPSE
jgi:hypothetical protein